MVTFDGDCCSSVYYFVLSVCYDDLCRRSDVIYGVYGEYSWNYDCYYFYEFYCCVGDLDGSF